MNDTPPVAREVDVADGSVEIRLNREVIGALEPVVAHGVEHWRYVTPTGYRSPFQHRDQVDAMHALVSRYRDSTEPVQEPRLEPVDGAEGVDGHTPMFEVYRCPPGCPQHPPVVVCGHDRQPWPCDSATAACAELNRLAAVMREDAPTDDEVWQDCAALLATRSRALATAAGTIQ